MQAKRACGGRGARLRLCVSARMGAASTTCRAHHAIIGHFQDYLAVCMPILQRVTRLWYRRGWHASLLKHVHGVLRCGTLAGSWRRPPELTPTPSTSLALAKPKAQPADRIARPAHLLAATRKRDSMALPAGGGCSAHGLGALHRAFRIRRRIFPSRRCTPCQVIAGASASGQSRAAEGAGWTDIVAGEGRQYRRGTRYQCPRL